MHRNSLLALAAIVIIAIFSIGPTEPARATGAAATEDRSEPGREIFLRKNCQQCHSVEARGIERTSDNEKTRGPDLSTLGESWSRDELRAYLEKGDPIGGLRHWKGFWGDEETLESLLTWLLDEAPAEGSDDQAAD